LLGVELLTGNGTVARRGEETELLLEEERKLNWDR